MSKFSKILAVLMTVCLLLGATTAFLVSADGDADAADTGVTDVKTYKTTYKKNTNPTPFTKSNAYDENLRFGLFDYLTLDMDVTIADGYTEYPAKFTFYTQNLGGTKGSNRVYVLKADDGFYYLGLNSTVPNVTDAARLSATPGVYDHITTVYKVNRTDGDVSSLDLLYYVNGKYVCKKNITADGFSSVGRVSVQGTWSANTAATVVMYTRTYKTGDFSGTNELAAIVADTDNNLYDSASDAIFYNAFYAIPGADYVASVDGKNVYIPDAVAAAVSSIKDGSEIETKVDIVDFDIPDGVDKFTVIYNPEETVFTLCKEDAESFFVIKNSETSYTVRKATDNDKLVLKRVVEYGEQEIVISTAEFVFLLTPETNVAFSVFDLNDMKLYTGVATDWTVDVDGEVPEAINLYNPEKIRPITDFEAALLREEFDGILKTTAVAEEGSIEVINFSTGYAYIAGYENNGVFTPILDSNGGYENYKDIATLESEMATWDEGVVYYEIVDGKAQVPGGSDADEANAVWNTSSPVTDVPENVETTDVTDLVKNTFKDNGTVDGYGVLIIR